jgi:hypothetical protein
MSLLEVLVVEYFSLVFFLNYFGLDNIINMNMSSAQMPPFPLHFDFMSPPNNTSECKTIESNPFAVPSNNNLDPFSVFPSQPIQPSSKGWTHQTVYSTSLNSQEKKTTEDMDIDLCVPCGGCGSKTYQWSARKELSDPVTKEKIVYCSIGCILRTKKVYNGYAL